MTPIDGRSGQTGAAAAGVSIHGLSIAFGAHQVLKNLNLDIRPSEFVVLLGASGCGKSTLLNSIAGLQEVSAGSIFIGDTNVTTVEPKDRGIAMVFQSYALYPRMTVRGNLSFGLQVARTPRYEINRRVDAAAQMLKIENLLDRRPAELSGGQRQRVAIGRALVRESGLFLFDEPLSNLDAQLRAELRVEIKRLHQKLGATMIYVTHDQVEALTLADRIAIMKDGVIQQLGSPDDVFFRPASKFVATFIGSPRMNFFPARVDEAGAIVIGDRVLDIAGPAGPERARLTEVGVRPEHIAVVPTGDPGMVATVELVEPMGSETVVWTRLGDVSLSILVSGGVRPSVGEALTIRFMAEHLHLFDKDGQRLMPGPAFAPAA